ncbi:hypothetical protein YYC_00033 [Plasmodium yoelii 17X]|uniref:Uncharacterized protein n=1 Tax=Plasmodium yoelii 17X TaxID=1323249 RepID=V7PV64_PLAYE|nr:hypothetical protein YYC_00033 [Plasmodium yoelii 17X]
MGQLIKYWNRYRKIIPKYRFDLRRKLTPEPNDKWGDGKMNLNVIKELKVRFFGMTNLINLYLKSNLKCV